MKFSKKGFLSFISDRIEPFTNPQNSLINNVNFGDPYELLNNKLIDPYELEKNINVIEDLKTTTKDILHNMYDLGNYADSANFDYDIDKAMANAINTIDSYEAENLKLYHQQVEGLKNQRKYQNKDILNEMHARQLINESESLKNEIINNQSGQSKNIKDRKPKLKNADKSYRPEVTKNGNNVEIDSIYNHSVPKKIHNSNNTHSPKQDVDVPKSKPDINTPDSESYKPQIGDNVINSETGERYVLSQIDKANPDLDIHKDTYYYNSPNGERLTRTSPIDPNANSNYKLDYDDMLSPDDVRRISNSFSDLETNTNLLDEAKSRLSSLKDQFDNGADDLNEIYQAEKTVRSLESKVANTRMQIDKDDLRYNSNGKYAYNINDKTRGYMDKADNLLGDYSETKYINNHEKAFKEVKPRQIIKPIESGIDNAIDVPTKNTVKSNIKNSTKRIRGKKKGQSTGRGGSKKVISNTGRINKNAVKNGPRKAPALKRRVLKGKSSTLKAIGRNGKVLNNIPRVKIPLSKKDVIKTAANLIVNEAATNTANTIIKNVDEVVSDTIPTPKVPIPNNTPDGFNILDGYSDDPMTWTDADIEDMANGDQDIYNELKKRRDDAYTTEASDPSSNSNNPETPTPEPEPPESTAFSNNFNQNDPSTWTDADIEEMAQGDPYYEDSLRKQRQQAINNSNTGNSSTPVFDPEDPTTWSDKDIKKMSNGDPDTFEDLMNRRDQANGIDTSGRQRGYYDDIGEMDVPLSGDNEIDDLITRGIEESDIEFESPRGHFGTVDKVMTAVNVLGAVSDYKRYRREGKGVVSSTVRAGANFAIGEALGVWALPVALVSSLPGAAIKGADMLYKENRRMNSAANFQVFGGAQFMDTQQLATMRQSGMEMAKMSQYNLQQSLMGNEATYLHR